MLKCLELLCWPSLKLLELILPMNVLPELAFLMVVGVFFGAMDFILTVVSILSIYTQLSHILIALTIIAWGSSPIELINLMIAAKKGELQIGLTSVLSGIVLAFYVLIPLAMVCKMLRRHASEIQILLPIHTSHMLMMPALVVTLVTTCVFWKTGMDIGKGSASVLIITYLAYITFMGYVYSGDTI